MPSCSACAHAIDGKWYLPCCRTSALESPTAIAYKRKDNSAKTEAEKWQLCELKNERDIENALACLSKVYSAATGRSG